MDIDHEPNLFHVLYSNSSVTKSEDVTQFNLGTAAGKIALYNFQWRFLTVILTANIKSGALDTFMKCYKKTTVLIDNTFDIISPRWTVSQFVFFFHGTSDIIDLLKWIQKLQHIGAKFLIVCTAEGCDERQINEALRGIGVYDLIILKPTDDSTQIGLYGQQFRSGSNCNLADEKLQVMDVYCENDSCFKSLYHRAAINVHQCPLVVSAVHNPPYLVLTHPQNPSGFDGAVVNFIVNYLNATLKIVTPERQEEWEPSNEDNTWSRPASDLINKRAHVAISRVPLSRDGVQGPFKFSIPYVFMKMIWITRQPKRVSLWMKVIRPLKTYLRITLLAVFVFILIINLVTKTKAFRKIARYFQTTPPKRSLLFHSWILFLGMSVLRITKKPTLLVLIYTWIWFCFIIRSSYQAALINCLKTNLFEHTVEAIEDVQQNGWRYGGDSSLRELYRNDPNIYDNWINLNKSASVDTLNGILNGSSDFVLAFSEQLFAYVLKKSKYREAKLLLLPHKILSSPIVVYFHNRSMLLEPVNRALKKMIEHGFMQLFLKNNYAHPNELFFTLHTSKDTYEQLNVLHLQGAFFALSLGYMISLGYFIKEVITGKLKKRSSRK